MPKLNQKTIIAAVEALVGVVLVLHAYKTFKG
jgi:hypothetical protein